MTPIRPYRISVYNRITGNQFAQYRSNQVPVKGDRLTVYANVRVRDDPFDLWGQWIVDEVCWTVSGPGSVNAIEIARESGSWGGDAYCDWAEIHVWPAQGPHWAKTPKWAEVLSPPEDDDEAASEEENPSA